jgi:MFS family permease
MTGPDANTQDSRPALTTHPLLGVAGVLLGALIATCTGRLMSVSLVDIRSALHLGVDEGAWINTEFNASIMFIGPFSVYLRGLLGPRRVLLACAWIFTVVSFLIPFLPFARSGDRSVYHWWPVPRGGFLHVQSANSVSAGHCCTSGGQMRSTLHERVRL